MEIYTLNCILLIMFRNYSEQITLMSDLLFRSIKLIMYPEGFRVNFPRNLVKNIVLLPLLGPQYIFPIWNYELPSRILDMAMCLTK